MELLPYWELQATGKCELTKKMQSERRSTPANKWSEDGNLLLLVHCATSWNRNTDARLQWQLHVPLSLPTCPSTVVGVTSISELVVVARMHPMGCKNNRQHLYPLPITSTALLHKLPFISLHSPICITMWEATSFFFAWYSAVLAGSCHLQLT